MESIDNFFQIFREEWIQETEDAEDFLSEEEAFVKVACNKLIEVGVLENPIFAKHESKNIKIDAFEIREVGDRWQIDLVVSSFHPEVFGVEEIAKDELKTCFEQGRMFIDYGRTRRLKESLIHESETELFELATRLEHQWDKLELVNIFVISNKKISVKLRNKKMPINELQLHYDRFGLQHFFEMNYKLEAINPDIEFVEHVPCLEYKDPSAPYQTILAVIPGEELARIYRTWGTRLLENNVRAFLQVKGSVNKSIRETLTSSPEMFLAFNNGLAVTVSDFVIENGFLKSLTDMQIVNGGQTTASLYHYRIDSGEDLRNVRVTAKIIKIPNHMDYYDVVKNISTYSNNQNSVKASDLDANSPFQKKLADLSKTVINPRGGEGGEWYFEQLRGGYLTDRNINKTTKDKKAFDKRYPKSKKLEKPDVARYLCAWMALPNIVSLGSQKCFNYFKVNIVPGMNVEAIDENFYKNLIAKAIIFRTAEQLAKKNKLTPYSANIVAYGVSLFVSRKSNDELLKRVWLNQEVGTEIQQNLLSLMVLVKDYFNGLRSKNVSEWAKKEVCWNEVRTFYLD